MPGWKGNACQGCFQWLVVQPHGGVMMAVSGWRVRGVQPCSGTSEPWSMMHARIRGLHGNTPQRNASAGRYPSLGPWPLLININTHMNCQAGPCAVPCAVPCYARPCQATRLVSHAWLESGHFCIQPIDDGGCGFVGVKILVDNGRRGSALDGLRAHLQPRKARSRVGSRRHGATGGGSSKHAHVARLPRL